MKKKIFLLLVLLSPVAFATAQSQTGNSHSLTLASSNAQMGSVALVGEFHSVYDLSSAVTQQGFTVLDVNSDQVTWYTANGTTQYDYSRMNAADDWLVTPGDNLVGGVEYTVSLTLAVSNENYPERMEMKAATGNTLNALTTGQTVAAAALYTNEQSQTYTWTFTPQTSGMYYLGIHAISDANMESLYLFSLEINHMPAGVTVAPVAWGTYTVTHGTTVVLAATPHEGFQFQGWSNGLQNDTISILVDDDTALTAMFGTAQYTVSASSADANMGSAAVLVVTPGAPAPTSAPSAVVDYGTTVNLSATPLSGYHFVQWEEADTVYGHTADTIATIYGNRSFTAVFAQDTHAYVNMGDGLLWATCNIGATNPYDYGDYFAWGETSPKNRYGWGTYSYCINGSSTNFTRYTLADNNMVLLPEDDAATANWHGEWRMPTDSEFTSLRNTDNYSWVWSNNYNGTSVAGMIVTRLTGPSAGNSIFLPATGYYSGENYFGANHQSYYWSSELSQTDDNSVQFAWCIHIYNTTNNNGQIQRDSYMRHYGFPVRAVSPAPPYSVTANASDTTMGSVTGGGSYTHGTAVTLTATPAPCYHLTGWSNGLTDDTITITVESDTSLTAIFERDAAKRGSIQVAACDSFSWYGDTYTSTPVTHLPTHNLQAVDGCDSTVSLYLTINYSSSLDTTAAAINSFAWNGTTYTATGDYTDSLTSVNGCDSTETLHLTITNLDTLTLMVNDTSMGSISLQGAFIPRDTVDLSTIHSDYTVQDGTVLTGTLNTSSTNNRADNKKISIAAGATVMLSNMNITGVHKSNYMWAGLTLLGDATIILDANTTNYIRGFYYYYPGIQVPVGATLTIKGEGELTAEAGKYANNNYQWVAAGIGGGQNIASGSIVIESGTINTIGGYGASLGGSSLYQTRTCGNIYIHGGNVTASSIGCGNKGVMDSIVITGGTITAAGYDCQAGIGCDADGSVNHIVITGGTINATGGRYAAGIGSGYCATVNHITITGGTITATGGQNGAGIGAGQSSSSATAHCGEIVIASSVTSVTANKGPNYTNATVNNIGHGANATCNTVIVGGQSYTDPDTTTYTYIGDGTAPQLDLSQPTIIAIDSISYIVQRGKRVVVQATPKPNYHLAEWSDGAAVNADNTDTLTVNGAMTLTAIFAHDPYNIGAAAMDTATGSAMIVYNGTSASDIPVEPDSVCTITASPNFGYHFVRWEEADSVYSRTADTSVTATSNRFFYAIFERTYDTITLAVNDTSMGSIALQGASFTATNTVNLDTIQGDYTVQDGTVLTGTLGGIYKISVAAGASVMLSNMNITGVHDNNYRWAGLNLLGDATIVLDDNTTNYIRGFYYQYPGIHVPVGATLTLRGNGELTASAGYNENDNYNMMAAGIGGGYNVPSGSIVIESGTITTQGGYGASLGGGLNSRETACGNIAIHGGIISATSIGCGNRGVIDTILITGGTVTAIANSSQSGIGCDAFGKVNNIIITGGTVNATGGTGGAGIGGGTRATVNHITITGGTITATGGVSGAGIGSGYGSGNEGVCGDITIATSVTSVTAIKGYGAQNIGSGNGSTCGTITVGGQPYTDDPNASSYTFVGNGSAPQDNISRPTVIAIGDNIYRIARGTTVVVQATPKPNHHLVEWSDSTAVNADNTDTLMVDGAMTLTAIFAHDPYNIGAATMDTSMGSAMVVYNGSSAGNILVEPSSVCTITATPNFGYHFVRWEEADSLYSRSADTSVTATSDRFFYAVFERTYDTITLMVNDTSMGSIALHGAFTPTDTVNLDTIQGDYTVQDGTVLTGTLGGNYKISVAAGASVMLSNMNITGIFDSSYTWAGLNLLGDATIVLDDSTTNYIRGFFNKYPGIHVPVGATLTIRGDGELTAESGKNENASNRWMAAGIGGGYDVPSGSIVIENGIITTLGGYGASLGGGYNTQRRACGNIAIHGGTISATCIGGGYNALIDSVLITGGSITARASVNQPGIGCDGSGILNHIIITGGTINATGGSNGAGIGCGRTTTVNHITITGGTITAKGGNLAAGIGSGSYNGHCGEIVIASSVTSVTAIKGNGSTQNIGSGESGTCDTVIVGGQPYTDDPNASSYTFVGDGSTPSSNIPQPSVIAIGDNIYRIARGTTVVVQATPKPNHHLAEWSDNTAVNADNTDTVMVNGSLFLTAIFAINPYIISTGANDTAMGSAVVIYNDSVASIMPVEPGATFFLEATAKPCYHFVCWTKGADTVASESIIELSATDTCIFMAHFERNLPLLGDTAAVACDYFTWYGTIFTASDTTSYDLLTAEGCDSTVTLHLTVNYSSTGDTTAVVCDSIEWYGTTYTSVPVTHIPTHTFTAGNAAGCDSTVTLHLTVNYSTFSDTTAVVCDQFTWYDTTLTASGEPKRLYTNAAGCDSTHTLHLTVNYSNIGDTTAVECDRFTWYDSTHTASAEPTHIFTNAVGCDSTVTLHLTVNYSNSGDTTAVECDYFNWYEHTGITASADTLTHRFVGGNYWGCDSTLTLHLTVNYSTGSDTTAVVCDSMTWFGTTYTTTPVTNLPTHLFTNAVGCDSTLTLHLTVNHSTTGDTTAVECDVFSWYNYDTITTSTDTLTQFFEAANQWGCDSTVTLHLTINYKNTGDTTAVVCDTFSWYEHTGLTASVDTLTHYFAAANQWGCDSTVTLHLTVNYQNTGDTTAVECDYFNWYEHTGITASADTLTHRFVGGNYWGCDSTVTLHLTVNYQNTGDTTAVECDYFSWYEHGQQTSSTDTLTHIFIGGNQWGCDSTLTLHLTINYQNTGDTTAVECDSFSWYEHTGLTSSINTLTHLFAGGNQWGCDSTVTLDLTVNYSNTGDTAAVKCDSMIWYGNTYTATADPTHLFTNIDNCDSTVTLHLTVNYSSTSDTSAVECDSFSWHGTTYTATADPTHLFTNAVGCDSVRTLHLTVNYQNTGDTTAVECDGFSWYEHTGLTSSSSNLTHLFPGGNVWGCDSTVTLLLTVNYQNTGDTTAVKCDQFSWYEHTGLTASVDTLTHLFVGGNRWGCDSTVTLHLTVNYQNTGDTTAVECDSFTWYEHHNRTSSIETLTHRFVGANVWGCDSTVTLHLTINYQNTGDTSAVECDSFSWYEHQNLTTNSNNRTHRFVGANQWNCDSTVTLHLTIHYQNTGDTSALTYEPYTWYEHQNMGVTQDVQHTFTGANIWGCDSTVTLHLRYALFSTSWEGATEVIYNSEPQAVISATYVDDTGRTQPVALTFTKGNEVITTPNYPVNAGVWNVVARPVLPVDSLSGATATLTILPATVSVTGAEVRVAKVADGTTTAEVTNPGTLNNTQGTDPLTHVTTAEFSDAGVGEGKTITLTYTLQGSSVLLNNYVLERTTEVYSNEGVIVEAMLPDDGGTFEMEQYGYCAGGAVIGYHLSSGVPDEYKVDFADERIADIGWRTLAPPGAEGSIEVELPEGLPTGDYTMAITFRDSRYPWIESAAMSATIHVNLPASYTKPLFYNVIMLIDTCECMSDVQWYHRATGGEWEAIPGATGYYYREVKGLTGEYFVSVKMDGYATYTCPQSDLVTLLRDEEEKGEISVYPNPTTDAVTVTLPTSNIQPPTSDLQPPTSDLRPPTSKLHELRVLNTMGVEMERRSFEGNSTTIDMSRWESGSYIVTVDGETIRVIKQ